MVFLSANVYEAVLRVYYPSRYSARGEADADGIREQATADLTAHLALIAERLGPYVLQSEYSILYMLASWFPGDKADSNARFPALGAHAERMSARQSGNLNAELLRECRSCAPTIAPGGAGPPPIIPADIPLTARRTKCTGCRRLSRGWDGYCRGTSPRSFACCSWMSQAARPVVSRRRPRHSDA